MGIISFKYVPKETIDQTILNTICNRIVEKLGEDFQLNMESVDEIPLTKRGKHRLLVQELDLKYDHPSLRKSIDL